MAQTVFFGRSTLHSTMSIGPLIHMNTLYEIRASDPQFKDCFYNLRLIVI
jgi:hypothetical protein